MKMKKTASGKKLVISRNEWETIGRIAGFLEENPDDYMGRHSHETEVEIDGKPVPVVVGFDAYPATREPHGELTPAQIEIVDIWGFDPSSPGRVGDSVMDLLGENQIEAVRREIEQSG